MQEVGQHLRIEGLRNVKHVKLQIKSMMRTNQADPHGVQLAQREHSPTIGEHFGRFCLQFRSLARLRRFLYAVHWFEFNNVHVEGEFKQEKEKLAG